MAQSISEEEIALLKVLKKMKLDDPEQLEDVLTKKSMKQEEKYQEKDSLKFPRISLFYGEPGKGEVSYRAWRYEVNCLIKDKTYSHASMLLGIRRSLRGEAADMVMRLGEEAKVLETITIDEEKNKMPTDNDTTVLNQINIDQDLNPSQHEELMKILEVHKGIFSTSETDIGSCDIMKHRIELIDKTPFKERYRRIPPSMIEEVRKHLEDLLARNKEEETKTSKTKAIKTKENRDTRNPKSQFTGRMQPQASSVSTEIEEEAVQEEEEENTEEQEEEETETLEENRDGVDQTHLEQQVLNSTYSDVIFYY
ncbi:hypothetical protein DPMN_000079 [Dreissena polymorpha]|uniref:Uncharacterized protein n=1 Tax=Dreissena polymorpha TaxID=45954 RepID=A0A9D4RRS0_DREPO|nr:hypothetical protein DPMN_000079 [Dreissena polymorpha]